MHCPTCTLTQTLTLESALSVHFRPYQPDVLAFEYVKSVVAACLAVLGAAGGGSVLAACLDVATPAQFRPRILCVGVGGGSVPLALAAALPGADVAAWDVCAAVLGAAGATGLEAAAPPNLAVSLGDGAAAVAAAAAGAVEGGGRHVDLLVVDAFDGDDKVPRAFTEPPFLAAAASSLHPVHGAAVINLHCGPKPGLVGALAAAWAEVAGGAARRSPRWLDAASPAGATALAAASAYTSALLFNSAPGCSYLVGARRQRNGVLVVGRGRSAPAGAAHAAASASGAASAAGLTTFDVADRASHGWWDVRRGMGRGAAERADV